MPVEKKLPKALRQMLADVRAEVMGFVDEQKSAFDDMSERWQESDTGTAVQTWLDDLEDAFMELERLEECEE